ncbi:uncharacterized protein LOC105181079 isoform X2 [Harpegnathos saltator]|uniref:uncharacterized protein LOC105181079 isoform X2 n=1 Tax=Harpegnathos saltator TaxID=610380 RepID=UPI000DBED29C|nr:uncharacterized protein LOC105181079 isoform X2 [Harpegnathos saltator]
MILFAKSCRICHQQVQLRSCKICQSDYYCNEHEEEFLNEHTREHCRKLMFQLNLDIISLWIDKADPCIGQLTFTRFSDSRQQRNIRGMNSFITEYMYVRPNAQSDRQGWKSFEYIYSDYLSGPLTFYYAMKKANLLHLLNINLSEFVVHIITSSYLGRKYVDPWELLLHLRPSIGQLTVVMVGPTMQASNGNIRVCNRCQKEYYGREHKYEIHSMTYLNYTKTPSYKQPNMVISEDFLKEAVGDFIKIINKIKCPFLLAATSETKGKAYIKMNKKLLHIEPIYNGRNNFKSLRPWRCLTTGSVYYRNVYLIVYHNLKQCK